MSVPKRHHFIPQWLMRQWSPDGKKVLGVDRRDKDNLRPFFDATENVNVEKYLYSFIQHDGQYDSSLETEFYSKLDSAACGLTSTMLEILKAGQTPVLDEDHRKLLWQFFFYNSFKRHPRTWQPFMERLDYNEVKRQAVAAAVADGADEQKATKAAEAIVWNAEMENNVLQMARGSQSEELLNQMANVGVTFLEAPEGASFLLPDTSLQSVQIRQGDVPRILFPISPQFALSPAGQDGRSHRVMLQLAQVKKLNADWYAASVVIIGSSDRLLKAIARKVDGVRLEF